VLPNVPAREYASFWQRICASLLDAVMIYAAFWLSVLVLALLLAVLRLVGVDLSPLSAYIEESPTFNDVFPYVLLFAVFLLYFGFLESSSNQASFGKQAFGIIVTDLSGDRISFGRAVGRSLASVLSALILMIGYLIQPFTEKRQALHDIIAGTLVLRK
jgi:uncharacterized RDD family membrane protein YckC